MLALPPLKEVVISLGIDPKKALGQNFLFDLNLTKRIARAAGDLKSHTIIEIGPGPGGLTRALLEEGAEKIVVIEQDSRCIPALNEINQFYHNKLFILNQDALLYKEEDLNKTDIKIIANLPYNIATVLLFKWLDKIHLFSSLTLMFQKEVADRIIAQPGCKAYGRLSVMTQFLCKVEHQFDINPQAFYPPPKVTSSVLNIYPRKQPFSAIKKSSLELICKLVFNQRRKTLRVSLKQLVDNPERLLQQANIDSSLRPEQLTLEQFCQLTEAYQNNKNQ